MAHEKARKERPSDYPERAPVPDDRMEWAQAYPGYSPPFFEHDSLRRFDRTKTPGGWADPADHRQLGRALFSYEGPVQKDAEERPQNPRGRTGIGGRGKLGKWGANQAADALLTRVRAGALELLLIQRKNGQWALPGGMVDDGEAPQRAATRELEEETGLVLDMGRATLVYQGYVDDPRNTDHAWMETTALHAHLSDQEDLGTPKGMDDAQDAAWQPVRAPLFDTLFASHGDLVRSALDSFQKSPSAAPILGQIQAVLRELHHTS